jgi:hypothetical protein
MSQNHSSTHHHNTKTSNPKITTTITLSTQEQALNSASQTKTFQPQRQDLKIESESHLRITICGGRAGWRPQTNTTPLPLILVGWFGC